MVASNPAVSGQTGWPIGFWWAELTHPYWEFTVHGYQADIASPDGGPQGPMYTFYDDTRVHDLAARCYQHGRR